MIFEVSEDVRALFNGEWCDAQISKVEAPGVYTVRWKTPSGKLSDFRTEGLCDLDLQPLRVSSKLDKEQAEASRKELQDVLESLYDRLENPGECPSLSATEDGQEGAASPGSSTAQDAAEDILSTWAFYEQREQAEREIARSGATAVELPGVIWRVCSAGGAPCFRTPDGGGEEVSRRADGAVVVAREMMFAAAGEGAEKRAWIVTEDGLWIPASHLALAREGPSETPDPWMPKAPLSLDGCRRILTLGRRAEARVIENIFREEPPAPASRALDALQHFFPQFPVRQNMRAILEAFEPGRDHDGWAASADAATARVLKHCLALLWEDIRGDPNGRVSYGCCVQKSIISGSSVKRLRFLVRHDFDAGADPGFLALVLRTGRIRVSDYLWGVGPEVSTKWSVALSKGLAQQIRTKRSVPRKGASLKLLKPTTDILYENIQSLLKFGYNIKIEKVLSAWTMRTWLKLKWTPDNALRTFRMWRKRLRQSGPLRKKSAREGLELRRLDDNLQNIIFEYVDDFRFGK